MESKIWHRWSIYKIEIDQGHGDQTCLCQTGRVEKGMDGEFGVCRCKLLHLGWISNGVLLYSTGNCVQCWVRTWWKIVWKKMNVCVCVARSLCCAEEIEGILQIEYNKNFVDLQYSVNSSVQQSDTVICMCTFFFHCIFLMFYHKWLDIFPCAI